MDLARPTIAELGVHKIIQERKKLGIRPLGHSFVLLIKFPLITPTVWPENCESTPLLLCYMFLPITHARIQNYHHGPATSRGGWLCP